MTNPFSVADHTTKKKRRKGARVDQSGRAKSLWSIPAQYMRCEVVETAVGPSWHAVLHGSMPRFLLSCLVAMGEGEKKEKKGRGLKRGQSCCHRCVVGDGREYNEGKRTGSWKTAERRGNKRMCVRVYVCIYS